jgi:hypothetical protein
LEETLAELRRVFDRRDEAGLESIDDPELADQQAGSLDVAGAGRPR